MTEEKDGQMSLFDRIEEFCIAVTKKQFPDEEENDGRAKPLREMQEN